MFPGPPRRGNSVTNLPIHAILFAGFVTVIVGVILVVLQWDVYCASGWC